MIVVISSTLFSSSERGTRGILASIVNWIWEKGGFFLFDWVGWVTERRRCLWWGEVEVVLVAIRKGEGSYWLRLPEWWIRAVCGLDFWGGRDERRGGYGTATARPLEVEMDVHGIGWVRGEYIDCFSI